MRRRAALAGLLAAAAAGVAPAQEPARLPVVVLDREALFAQSAFGRRVRADIEAASEALGAENRRIEAELEAEERDLTERRATTDPEAFRDLAAAFDARVEAIRAAQDAKGLAIQLQTERAQQVFEEEAGPILSELAGAVGALVVLDRRMVIAASGQVDITDLARRRIDAELGDGARLAAPPPEPPVPDPAPDPGTDPGTGGAPPADEAPDAAAPAPDR